MTSHCSILAWRIPWIEEPGRLHYITPHRVRQDRSNLVCTHRCRVKALDIKVNPIFSENGHPLQYSCLKIPMGRGTWRATVRRVTKSQTGLKTEHTFKQITFQYSSSLFTSILTISNESEPNSLKISIVTLIQF